MKNIKLKLGCFIMSTVLTVMLFGNINAEAASLTSQQKKIYKECMSDYLNKTDWPDWWTSYVGDHTKECTEFAVADLNNDGVKELLVYSNAGASWQWGTVYRVNKKPLAVTYYDNGKKKKASFVSDNHRIAFTQIVMASSTAFIDECYGHMGVHTKRYYRINKNHSICEVAYYDEYYDSNSDKTVKSYYVLGKKTSKKKFVNEIKKLGKLKSIKYYSYTDENVAKYMK